MKKKIGITIIWGIGIITLLFFLSQEKSSLGDFKESRVFKDSLSLLKKTLVYKPGLLQLQGSKLYFVSWEDATLTKFDIKDWKVEKIFGRKGKGPTENINISSYEIKENSYLTCDQGKKSIQEVSFKDSLIFYQKVSFPFFNTTKVGDVFLLSGSDGNDYIQNFSTYNVNTSKIKKIEVNDDELKEKYSSLINHGAFVKNKNYEVYVTFYNNKFFVFDKSFNFEYSSEMIYNVSKPRFKYMNGILIPDRRNIDVNQDAYLGENNQLYIISNIVDKEKLDYKIIDIYDLLSKEYISSFKIPNLEGEGVREILIEKNKLYALYINAITSYEIIKQ